MKTKWKFLREVDGQIKSNSGECIWKLGELKKHKGDLDICHAGFHCSDTIYEAFSYVQGEILAQVEVGGKSVVDDDKSAWSEMKIFKAWKWQKQDSVALAIYAAELVIDNFEKEYPDDKRPREAIEAAKKYLKNPTEENRIACDKAAESVRSAAWSTWSAARSARSARSAAESAARSAWSAARSAARSAAESAAKSALIKKINKFMTKRVKKLEKIK